MYSYRQTTPHDLFHDRIVLMGWDWRYKIGFDVSLRKRLQDQINGHTNRAEKDILCELVEHFTKLVSLDALIESLSSGEVTTESVQKTRTIEDNLLYVPRQLESRFMNKIDALDLPSNEVAYFLHLLDVALTKDYRSPHEAIFYSIFGDELYQLLERGRLSATLNNPRLPSRKTIIPESRVNKFVDDFLSQVSRDLAIKNLFGPIDTVPFETTIAEGDGFAEYWPVELSPGAEKDYLVICVNEDSMVEGTLLTTLAHELVPGHAYFYSKMRQSIGQLLDYGAMTLIEGWATWCEWHILPSEYSAFARSSRLESFRFFGTEDPKQPEKIMNTIMRQGYSRREAEYTLLYYYQYPCFGYSYSLGALWFENYLSDKTPGDFFSFLKDKSWGDFFSLW